MSSQLTIRYATGPRCPSSNGGAGRTLKVDNWVNLKEATVEIRRNGRLIRTGRVDAATLDSTMLWISQDGIDRRTLIHKQDGYEVWVDPATAHGNL